MFKLTPTNPQFFDYFDRSTDVLVRAARQFLLSLENFNEPARHADEMHKLEHEGDEITHQTMELLDKSFITPLERSDIRRLVMRLDDVLDFVDDAARRLAVYEITTILPEVQSLAQVLVDATQGVQVAVKQLRNLRKRNEILALCIEIHRLEDEGDKLHYLALGNLFKSGLDPLAVIKWKDIIEDIEQSIDRCQDVADIVEGIVLENA